MRLAFASLMVATAAGLSAQESAPDIPDYVPAGGAYPWIGTWDLSEETCADPDSIYRLRLTREDMAFGAGDNPGVSWIQDTFSAYHTDYRIKLADRYDRGEDQVVYRLVFPDSRPMMYLERLPAQSERFTYFRRIYIRCPVPEAGQ